MTQYKVAPLSVSDKEAFSEASREELRVLIALIERDGRIDSVEELAALAKTSKARASASLVLWEEAKVISTADTPSITEEFEQRLEAGVIEEVAALDAARTIRSRALADMISECAALLGRATLNTTEVKKLTALSEQYSLSPEYILTLAAYMAERGKLNISRLADKAIHLVERDIDTAAALEFHIASLKSESEAEFNFRGIFGIFDRALSKTEKEAFNRWSREYGYFTDIVGEAYDIAVTKYTRGYVGHADKLLTRWFETGCRTLSECRARYDADEAEKKAAKADQAKKAPAKPKKERYGNFDPQEAFMKALNRSYGKKDGEK